MPQDVHAMELLDKDALDLWRGGVTSGGAAAAGMSRGDTVAMAAVLVLLETDLCGCLGLPKADVLKLNFSGVPRTLANISGQAP